MSFLPFPPAVYRSRPMPGRGLARSSRCSDDPAPCHGTAAIPDHPSPADLPNPATPPGPTLPPATRRDPAGVRRRIMAAARREFARHGFAGARVDRIARLARVNKQMLYYHIGDKAALYLAVLEAAYADIRTTEHTLQLDALAPHAAILRLVGFTWHYFLDHPEFLALLNSENLQQARALKRSSAITQMNSPLVGMIAAVLQRGEAAGAFRPGVDPVQLYISIAGLAYFYVGNNATLSAIFGRDLLSADARAARLAHMQELVLAGLRA